MVAIFYPFSQFCEINISLRSQQTQPNTAPNLFQRGVEYGKYVSNIYIYIYIYVYIYIYIYIYILVICTTSILVIYTSTRLVLLAH